MLLLIFKIFHLMSLFSSSLPLLLMLLSFDFQYHVIATQTETYKKKVRKTKHYLFSITLHKDYLICCQLGNFEG